jgi:CRP-like cAMP-binding protein
VSEAETVERLRGVPLLAALDDQALERIADLATGFDVPAGHVLAEHGQPGSGMFVITEGAVVVELPSGPIELGPGEFVGELSLLADVGRVARVRASTPVSGLAIGRKEFSELLEREPRVGVAMLPVLAHRLAAAESS